MAFRDFWRNALALTPREPAPELDAWIDAAAAEVVRRRLAPALLLFLGSSLPAAFWMSQLLVFAEPIIQTMFHTQSYPRLVSMLEDRDRVGQILKAVERQIAAAREPRSY